MVLALDALAPDGRTIYNAASWIRSGPEANHRLVDTTLAEMRALAALPMTDAEPGPTGPRGEAPSIVLLLIAFWLGLAAFLVRADPRRHPVR